MIKTATYKMRKISLLLVSGLLGLLLLVQSNVSSAAILDSYALGGGTSLGQLIVLDKIFDNNGKSTFGDLGELIVLDRIFGGGGFIGGTTRTGSGGILGGSSLGQLIVLDKVFDDGNGKKSTLSNIGELIVLDRLFSGGRYLGGSQVTGY
jgi:hypothetical protein